MTTAAACDLLLAKALAEQHNFTVHMNAYMDA